MSTVASGGGGKTTIKKKTTSGISTPTAAQLLAMAGQSNYTQQAADMYAPQFDFLNQQAANTKSQFGQGDSTLKRLYDNLVGNINHDSGAIDLNYSNAADRNEHNTVAGLQRIGGIYDSSAAKEAALLQSLGIQAAAPDVLAKGTRNRSAFEGSLAANNAAYGNQLNAEHSAARTFNTQAATISKEQGTEHRAALQSKLQDALTQIAGQRAQLQSGQANEANSLASSAAQMAYKQQQDQANNDLAYTKLALQYGPQSAAGQKANTLAGPQGALAKEASMLYPQGGAQNAIKAINDTMEAYGGQTPSSVQDFVSQVLKRNPHATDVAQLTDLAQLLYSQLGLRNPTPSLLG